MKFKVRETSIKYGKERAKAKHKEEKELEERVKHLQDEVDNSINDTKRRHLLTSRNECKNKLQDFLHYRTQGLLLRCKAQYYEEGEKNTKYFFNSERRENINKNNEQITKIRRYIHN